MYVFPISHKKVIEVNNAKLTKNTVLTKLLWFFLQDKDKTAIKTE